MGMSDKFEFYHEPHELVPSVLTRTTTRYVLKVRDVRGKNFTYWTAQIGDCHANRR